MSSMSMNPEYVLKKVSLNRDNTENKVTYRWADENGVTRKACRNLTTA